MSKYTIELRKVCDIYTRKEVENWFKDYNLEDYLTQDEIDIINKRGTWNKEKLAKKIINHYFMHEIGLETPALFKHYAKIEMKKIMERYLPKIYSNFLEYDPLSNVDFTETYTREIAGQTQNQGSSNSTSQNNASGLNVNSDTPQGQISKQKILNGAYASQTNASETESEIEDNTTTENQGTSNTVETFTRHEEGDNGVIITNQRLVKEYREIIVAIDEEIINELNCLFMGIY